MSRLILGVDPGITGALAWVDEDGKLVAVEDMPVVTLKSGKRTSNKVSPQLLSDLVWHREKDTKAAVVEQVGAMPKQGVVSTFNFGRSFGLIEGVLAGATLRTYYASPAHWIRAMGINNGKDGSRAMAMREWPEQAKLFARAKDNGRSDAALIALWALHNLVR